MKGNLKVAPKFKEVGPLDDDQLEMLTINTPQTHKEKHSLVTILTLPTFNWMFIHFGQLGVHGVYVKMGNTTSYIRNMEFTQFYTYLTPKTTSKRFINSSWNEPTLELVVDLFFFYTLNSCIHDGWIYMDVTNPKLEPIKGAMDLQYLRKLIH